MDQLTKCYMGMNQDEDPRWDFWGFLEVGSTNQTCYPLVNNGKHTKNDGKSPFLMGKSTINGHVQ